MRVRQIDVNDVRDVRAFIRLPFTLYKNHPLWVPPLIGSMKAALDTQHHPAYQHTAAAFYVVEEEGQVLARAAAIHNQRHSAHTGQKTAFFGFFEAAEDQTAVNALFDTLRGWARQRGLTRLIGPRGLLGSDAGGVLVEGFEHPPALNVPYNYAYYDALLQGAGFIKDTQHYSGYIDLRNYQFPEKISRVVEKIQQHGTYRLKSFSSMQELLEWAPRALEVHRQAFVNNHEYFPPSESEAQQIISDLASVADPRLIKLVTHGEQVVGFILAYPNINAGIRQARGRLWPLGWYHLLRAKKQTRWLDVNGLGILPEERGMGSNTLLYAGLLESALALGYEHLEAVMVDENNYRSKADNLTMGVTFYKTHRCYQMDL